MTREQNIEKIRAACVAANPERWNNPDNYEPRMRGWDIRLADVLLATKESKRAYFIDDIFNICDKWNLRRDSLTDQSDATLQLLSDLSEQE